MQRLPTPMFTLVVSHRLKLHCFRLLVYSPERRWSGSPLSGGCMVRHFPPRYIHPTFLRCFRTSSREVKLGWPTVNSLSGKEIGRWVRPALPNTRGSDCMGRGHVKALVSEGIESRASIRAGLPGWGKEFERVHWSLHPNWQSDPLSVLNSSNASLHARKHHRSRAHATRIHSPHT